MLGSKYEIFKIASIVEVELKFQSPAYILSDILLLDCEHEFSACHLPWFHILWGWSEEVDFYLWPSHGVHFGPAVNMSCDCK